MTEIFAAIVGAFIGAFISYFIESRRIKKQKTIEYMPNLFRDFGEDNECYFLAKSTMNKVNQGEITKYADIELDARRNISDFLNLLEFFSVGIAEGVYDESIVIKAYGNAFVKIYKQSVNTINLIKSEYIISNDVHSRSVYKEFRFQALKIEKQLEKKSD